MLIIPVTPAEVEHARCRPPAERTRPPHIGEQLLYRHNEWDDQLLAATVLAVQHQHAPHMLWGDPRVDQNMWQLSPEASRTHLPDGAGPDDLPAGWLEPHPDPWPLVRLHVPDLPMHIDCREARTRGSAGWLREG